MSKSLVGTIQTMQVLEKNDDNYVLENESGQANLPGEVSLGVHGSVDVFIYTDKNQVLATTALPTVIIGTYGWAVVKEIIPRLGAYIDIGTAIDVLIPESDLPAFQSVWPEAGGKMYISLKKDRQDRLFAVPAKENIYTDLFVFAENVELNDGVSGHVIRPGKEGTVIITEENYRGFIHHTEREKEPRLGEYVTGRVIEVKADGTLNVSLRPLKHERIDDDAEKIIAYLEANDGVMAYGNKTDPEIIENTFGISKSAFKRALGRLLKERKIQFVDGKTMKL